MSVEPTWRRRRLGERLGRYVLGSSLGAGGAARVHLARLDGPRGFERVLALKIVHEHLLEDQEFATMFLDEANLAVRLAHPNIVHTYELGHQGALLFLAMEYLPGKPLSRVYRRAFERGRPLPYDLVAWIGARAADALHYAHELTDDSGKRLAIVHRDVSPDNLIVTYDGQPKLIDFGIARAEGRLAATGLGRVKGKFRYMAPEYALGQDFDQTLDFFALGATLYEVALGLAAFEAGDETRTLERLLAGEIVAPSSIRPDFPPELTAIIRRTLDMDASRRYATGKELAADLDAFARLSAREASERLGALLRELFADEIAAESGWVSELRALKPPPTLEEITPTEHHVSLGPRRAEPSRLWVAAGALATLVVVALTLVFSNLRAEHAPNGEGSVARRADPVEERVAIDVSVQPASARATIQIQGHRVSERPARMLVARGRAPLKVEVSAPGFEPALLEVVPDRDHFLVVPLVAEKPVVPPAAASAEPPRAPPRPAKSTVGRPAPPPSARESGVIRDNPFQPR
jgi:serine/threonine-protein kinase